MCVMHECFRSKGGPNDLLLLLFFFFGLPEDTSCCSQRQGNNGNTSRLKRTQDPLGGCWAAGSHEWEFAGDERQKQRRRELGGERKEEEKSVCMHVMGGGGIPPEPQLTPTHRNIAAQEKQAELGFSFGTASLVRAQALLWNIGHWLAVREETGILLFPRRNNTSEIPVRAACERSDAPVSQLDGLLYDDDWKMAPTDQPPI